MNELHEDDVYVLQATLNQIGFDLSLLQKHLKNGEFVKAQANYDQINTKLKSLRSNGYFQ